jgi:hypothetical protein
MDVLSGTDLALRVDFLSAADDLTVPDADTVSFSVFSAVGVRLAGPVALTPMPEDTGVTVKIDALVNTIGADRVFDQRTVIVSWMAGGASGARRETYRLVPFPLYKVSPEDVRNVVGIASDELPDTAIDVYSGYLLAGSLFSSRDVLDAALTSGSLDEVIANRIVAYTVVLEMIPALSQRILQSKTDGTLKTDRLKTIDVAAIAAGLAARRTIDVNQLAGVTNDQLGVSTLILLTSPAIDPVTGNAPDTTGA